MTTGAIALSILSIVIAAVSLFRNFRGDTRRDAGQLAEILVKLDIIDNNVKEVKLDLKDKTADIEKVKERLIIVEERIEQLKHEREG